MAILIVAVFPSRLSRYIRGRWRVVETPGYDMAVAGAFILFDEGGGEFAFDCLTGSINGACDGDALEFD